MEGISNMNRKHRHTSTDMKDAIFFRTNEPYMAMKRKVRKASRGLKKSRKRRKSDSILDSIPPDIVVEIVIRLASSSLTDFCNVKQCCKELSSLSKDGYVLRHVSLEGIEVSPWRTSSGLTSFLSRCEDSGNPEALYRRAVVECFCNTQPELACELLETAAKLGHEDAMYLLAILLLFHMDDQSTRRGTALMKEVEARKRSRNVTLSESRKKCKKILQELWQENLVRREKPICSDSHCRSKKPVLVPGWEGDEWIYDCKACQWDHELTLFSNMQRGF